MKKSFPIKRKARTQNGQSWAVKFKQRAPNTQGHDTTMGQQGRGNPQKDLVDRLGEAMANVK